MKTVLHIVPHLGGGVGRVLLNYLMAAVDQSDHRHSVACLDSVSNDTVERVRNLGIPITTQVAGQPHECFDAIARADMVLLHWWNHPLLYDIMIRHAWPPARLLLWSHVSGYTPTQCFTDGLLAFPDIFVVAAPYSLDAAAIQRLSQSDRAQRVKLVFSCAGIEHVAATKCIPHEQFTVGYIGAVDDWKMHRNFIAMSAAANIPGVRFIVCGGTMAAEFQQMADDQSLGHLFDFRGHVQDVASVLGQFDVFGYPINPGQSGTGEQALIEALAAGVPPVVLDNGAERFIVEDGHTGIIAANEQEYAQGLEYLYHHPEIRRDMSINGRLQAQKRFSIDNTLTSWEGIYDETMRKPKRSRSWHSPVNRNVTGAQLFIESLGIHGGDYLTSMLGGKDTHVLAAEKHLTSAEAIFHSQTRGSVSHYRSFFPDDPYLNLWSGLMRLADGHSQEGRLYIRKAAQSLAPERYRMSEPLIQAIQSNPMAA